jgi:hypothetical protein
VLPITSEWPEQQARRLLLPLLREIGDSKRVTSAGRRGSIAERLFRRAWSSLLAGQSANDVRPGSPISTGRPCSISVSNLRKRAGSAARPWPNLPGCCQTCSCRSSMPRSRAIR